jgi:Holliday junction resolvase
MTPEGKVKARLKKQLNELGIYHFSPFQAGMGRAGIPDVIGCYRGVFVAFECKAGSNKPTALQEREMQAIRDAGGHAYLINEDNVNDLQEILKWIKK